MGLIKLLLHDIGYRKVGVEVIDSTEYDISDCYSFEDDIEIQQKRDGISGVFVEISIPQSFYKEAYTVIRDTFEEHGLFSYGRLSIYRRDNIDVTKWDLLDTFELDFSSISIQDDSLDIDIVKLNLQQIINSNSGTKYDIPTWDNGRTESLLLYDRMYMEFERNLNILIDNSFDYSNSIYIFPQISVNSNKSDLTNSMVVIRDVQELSSVGATTYPNALITNNTGSNITVNISFSFYASYSHTGTNPTTARLEFASNIRNTATVYQYYNLSTTQTLITGSFSATLTPSSSARGAGMLYVRLFFNGDGTVTPLINSQIYFTVNFTAKDKFSGGTDLVSIPARRASNMLSLLVNNMTGSENYISSIDWIDSDTNNNIVLVAAESVRGYGTSANYHISFSDFERWIKTLGYVPIYPADNEIKFVNFETLYSSEELDILTKEDVSNLEISGTTEHSFTNVQIGYPEQKYDSENGRFNVNGTFDYSTGLILKDENTISLVSPFRSDQVGVELLLFGRSTFQDTANTTDSRSDNDIFAFKLNRSSETSGTLNVQVNYTENSTIKTYDGALNPRELAGRWIKYLGISNDILSFEATTANRGASVTGYSIYEDLLCPNKIMSPVSLKIDCKYIQELYNTDAWVKQITFPYGNTTYKGYLSNSLRKFSREETSTLELIGAPQYSSKQRPEFSYTVNLPATSGTVTWDLPVGYTISTVANIALWVFVTANKGDSFVTLNYGSNITGSVRTTIPHLVTEQGTIIRLTIIQTS